MKKSGIFVLVLVLMLSSVLIVTNAKNVQASIAGSVLRFHIIANSNEDFDQELKIRVRNRIVNETAELFRYVENLDETKQIVSDNIELFKNLAKDEVNKNGYDYNVAVRLATAKFPTKRYGNAYLPAGKYQALEIVIGNGHGRNWWCVMFPPLCFTSGIGLEFDEAAKLQLKRSLSASDYQLVSEYAEGSVPIKIKFKCVEFFAPLFTRK